MISRRRKINIIIITISVVIVLGIAIMVYLYMTTDFLKSNDVLFGKYLGIAAQNVEALLEDQDPQKREEQYDAWLENNKYKSSSQISVKYTNGVGTTDENTRNSINNLRLFTEGKIDKQNGFAYENIVLKKDEANVSNIEYLKTDDKYGLRFSDLFNQYLVVSNKDLKKVASKLELDPNTVPNTIQEININKDIKPSAEEIENFNNKYVDIIKQNYSKEKFTSVKKANVTVRDQSMMTNSYTLELTKEELNNIYISILEQIKQDETLLSRINIIDQMFNPEDTNEEQDAEQQAQNEQNQDGQNAEQQNQAGQEEQNTEQQTTEQTQEQPEEEDLEGQEENKTLKQKMEEKIDSLITEIKNKNIGDDAVKITVFEKNRSTVKTTIETQEYKVNLETLKENGEVYVQLATEIFGLDENSDKIVIEKKASTFNINRERKLGQNIHKTNLTQESKIEEGKKETNTTLEYDIGRNKVEINMVNRKEIVNEFEKNEKFANDNSVLLNTLTNEQYENIKNTLNDKLIEKLQNVTDEVNYNDIFKMLHELEILPEEITIENILTLTRSEISKFNAEFEIYKGQEVDSKAIENLMPLVRENLENVVVVDDFTIKLNIEKGKKNEELANKVVEIITNEKNKGKKYSIEYEYREDNNMLSAVIIKMIDKN